MTYYLKTSLTAVWLLRCLFEGITRLYRTLWLILRQSQIHLFTDCNFPGAFLCLFKVIYIRTLVLVVFCLSSIYLLISQVDRVVFHSQLFLEQEIMFGFLLGTFGLNNNTWALDHFFHFLCAWHWYFHQHITHIWIHVGAFSGVKRPEWLWFASIGECRRTAIHLNYSLCLFVGVILVWFGCLVHFNVFRQLILCSQPISLLGPLSVFLKICQVLVFLISNEDIEVILDKYFSIGYNKSSRVNRWCVISMGLINGILLF